jgi:KRAB domain-containing zinc finger protein
MYNHTFVAFSNIGYFAVFMQTALGRDCKCHIPECSKTFSKSSQLRDHINQHKGIKPYIRKNNEIFACSFQDCGKDIGLLGNLKRHGEMTYVCDICNKRFAKSRNLRQHITIHSKKTFVCRFQDCGKQFKQLQHLKLHIRKHTGVRPYECKICNKPFKQSANLSYHIRIHSKETFVCIFRDCGKQFSLLRNMRNHIRTHTGERPYECAVCKKRFTVSGSLSRHMKRLHTEKEKVAKRTVE